MDTDDFTLGLMMDCWVKIIYGQMGDGSLKRWEGFFSCPKCDKTKNNSRFSRRRRVF